MVPPPRRTRRWLLTAASAGALLPGCAEEEPDIGVVVRPDAANPIPQDAGNLATGVLVYPDSGHPVGTVVVPDAGITVRPDAGPGDAGPTDAGSLPEVDSGIVVRPDAGPKDAGCNRDASPLLTGIVFAPPDASCMPFYPGIMPRNDPNQ